MSESITTPVGRLVEGSLYKGNSVDANKQPLVFKRGANVGQPRTTYYFAVAIPKGTETHWNETAWGQVIFNVGKAAFPKRYQHPDFSWKIIDGDSTIPNQADRKPCDKEGFAGNWVLKFSRSYAPKVFNRDGSKELPEEGLVNLGDWVQVNSFVAGNESDQRPGVYLNHLMVSFSGYGERIIPRSSLDATTVGFGQAPLPPEVSEVPLAAFVPAPVSTPTAVPTAVPTSVSTPAVAPYPQILGVPPLPLGGIPRMTAKAQGATYDQFIASGWTDQQLIEHGMMVG